MKVTLEDVTAGIRRPPRTAHGAPQRGWALSNPSRACLEQKAGGRQVRSVCLPVGWDPRLPPWDVGALSPGLRTPTGTYTIGPSALRAPDPRRHDTASPPGSSPCRWQNCGTSRPPSPCERRSPNMSPTGSITLDDADSFEDGRNGQWHGRWQ